MLMETLLQRKKQLVVIGLLIVSFFLLMDLNTRLNLLFRLTNSNNEMKTSVAQLESTKQVLLTSIARATSDAGLDAFARGELGWVKDKDNPVLPVPDSKATPVSNIRPTPTPIAVDHWQKWWALFFGQ
jgi:hypothetical protein